MEREKIERQQMEQDPEDEDSFDEAIIDDESYLDHEEKEFLQQGIYLFTHLYDI